MSQEIKPMPKYESLKEIATGFIAIILGAWAIVAVFAFFGLNIRVDDAGNAIMGWQWYHWIVLGPLEAVVLAFVIVCAWALGGIIRGNP